MKLKQRPLSHHSNIAETNMWWLWLGGITYPRQGFNTNRYYWRKKRRFIPTREEKGRTKSMASWHIKEGFSSWIEWIQIVAINKNSYYGNWNWTFMNSWHMARAKVKLNIRIIIVWYLRTKVKCCIINFNGNLQKLGNVGK